jgi:predicted nucleic acid-binding protein
MRTVFADTNYWVALVNWNDDLHESAVRAAQALGSARTVTTDGVLVEFLNHYAEYGGQMRETAARLVHGLLDDSGVEVVPQDREFFLAGLELFEQRRDKGYSLVDCMSMRAMRERGIMDALTYDRHFEQEGFRALLRDGAQ